MQIVLCGRCFQIGNGGLQMECKHDPESRLDIDDEQIDQN